MTRLPFLTPSGPLSRLPTPLPAPGCSPPLTRLPTCSSPHSAHPTQSLSSSVCHFPSPSPVLDPQDSDNSAPALPLGPSRHGQIAIFLLTSRWMLFSQERLLQPGKCCPCGSRAALRSKRPICEVPLHNHHLLPGIFHKSLGDREIRTKKSKGELQRGAHAQACLCTYLPLRRWHTHTTSMNTHRDPHPCRCRHTPILRHTDTCTE